MTFTFKKSNRPRAPTSKAKQKTAGLAVMKPAGSPLGGEHYERVLNGESD
jgi:hypothetical protein